MVANTVFYIIPLQIIKIYDTTLLDKSQQVFVHLQDIIINLVQCFAIFTCIMMDYLFGICYNNSQNNGKTK